MELAGFAAVGFGLGRLIKSRSLNELSLEARLHARMSRVVYNEVAYRQEQIDNFRLDGTRSNVRMAVYTDEAAKLCIVAIRGTTLEGEEDLSSLRNLGDVIISPGSTLDACFDVALARSTCGPAASPCVSQDAISTTPRGATTDASRISWCVAHMCDIVSDCRARNLTISMTGHSLGGVLAMSIAVRPEAFNAGGVILGGHVFNAGAGLREMARCMTAGFTEPEIHERSLRLHHHHCVGDPVSMLYSRGTLHVYRPRFVNAHTLDNFL